MRESFKTFFFSVVGFFAIIALLLVVLAFLLRGMVWASDKALPWLNVASLFVLAICIIVLLPLSLFRRTRLWAGNGYYLSSFVFGTMLFAYSCVFAYEIWGYTGLIFGLFFAGVGVVPVAYLATIFHGYWRELGELVFDTVLTFGVRAFGLYLQSKAASQRRAQLALSELDEGQIEADS